MLVSNTWIESLFSEDATRLSPLDIRLTAAAQFRLLALMCNFTQTTIGDAINVFLQEEIVNAHVIARPSFEIQTESLFSELNSRLDWSLRSQRVVQIVMFLVKQNNIHTAVNTNAFHLSVPGSNIYQSIDNYYPLNDNASFTQVSIQCVLIAHASIVLFGLVKRLDRKIKECLNSARFSSISYY